MIRRRLSWLSFLPLVAIACGGSSSNNQPTGGDGGGTTGEGGSTGGDGGTTGEGGSSGGEAGTPPTGSNVAALIVDQGPAGAGGSVDVPFITVTVCVPGSTTCQTIDHVTVDTGSSGLRILASALKNNIALPQVNATTGDPLVECFQFEDGYVWGSVRTADVKIGGEVASGIPLELVGDPTFATVPTSCSSSGSSEDTLQTFGANGLIGVNQLVPDCGDFCSTAPAQSGAYYSCAGTTCTPVTVAVAAQIANPIASFPQDNNGAIMEFGTVPPTGAATLAGSMIFGIGTQSNNGLGSAQVLTLDDEGNFTTVFNGATLSQSYIDSGTNYLSFDDSSITPCSASSDSSGFYCPASPVTLTAQNKGLNGVTSSVSFSVESADTLFAANGGNNAALDDLAGPEGDNTTFAWGFPFFIGRSVYIGLDGATTPGGKGPLVAY